MAKHFYSHIVEITEISLEIGNLDIPKEDRVKLISLAQENLHHSLLDLVLSHLSEGEKQTFLSHLVEDDNKNAWDLFASKVENAEEKIVKEAMKIKDQLKRDIKRIKK